MSSRSEELDDSVVLAFPSPEEAVLYLETRCAHMSPVVAAAVDWFHTSSANRKSADARLRRAVEQLLAHRPIT